MKKLLLILTSAMLLISSCSSDDNNNGITYDEIKGYLTNIESVKYGLIGTWEDPEQFQYNDMYEVTFDETTMYTILTDDEGETFDEWTGPYSVILENGKFYVEIEFEDEDEHGNPTGLRVARSEIRILNKTTLNWLDHKGDITNFRLK